MKKTNFIKLSVSIIAVQLIGISGSLFTAPSIPDWYGTLIKPAFTPPSWLFGPVWTLLFLMMGVSAYLIWREGFKHRRVKVALGLFLWQLFLNVLWSALFFGLHSPLLAFIEIIILWLAIAQTIMVFHKISKVAAWLLMPYIFWVSFATLLNFSIMMLNR